MGTDFIRFIREANRILRTQGELWVAEVVSRIPNVETFVAALEKQGFKAIRKDTSNKMFAVFQLAKIGEMPSLFSTDPEDLLKP
ncbi:25S rRNA (adenine645-N1)-methyltransferase, partial [Coemansia sp. RSA 1804]